MENKEFEQLEKLLYQEAEKINPPESDLKAVLLRLPQSVTEKKQTRYIYAKAEKGRAFHKIINTIENIMNNFWKIALPVGAVALVVLMVGYFRYAGLPSSDKNLGLSDNKATSLETAEFASAEINNAVDEISQSILEDDLLAELEAEDAIYLDYEDQALASFDNIALVYE